MQHNALLTPELLLQFKSIEKTAGRPVRKALMGFYPHLDQKLLKGLPSSTRSPLSNKFPFIEFEYKNENLLYIYPGMGAPLAAACLELAIAMGVRQVLFCGSTGSLLPSFKRGELLIVNKALIDEGTSHHYQNDDFDTILNQSALNDYIFRQLTKRNLPVREGMVWTTDALFRETEDKVARAVAQGCCAVDMESSALFSVAKMYGVEIAGCLMAADALWGRAWQARPEAIEQKGLKPLHFLELALNILVDAPSALK